MTSQQPYIIPKLTDSPKATDYVLDSYLLHIQHTTCNCSHETISSSLFEVWILPNRQGGSTRHLKPADGVLRATLEIGTTRLPPKTSLVCWKCVSAHTQLERQYDTEASWRETLKRKYAPEIIRERAPAPKAPTLDQL
jgi:hypothetical protein